MLGFSAFVSLVVVGLAIALAVAWVLMPFILAGVRRGVHDLLKEQQRTNALLAQLLHNGDVLPPDEAPRAQIDRRYPPV